MAFDDTYVVTRTRQTASLQDVADAERLLGVRLPAGYADFVTGLGTGLYSGYVRVYPPERVVGGLDEFRARVSEYYFWEDSADVLPRERVVGSVVVGDTVVGDEIVFHPDDPGRLYVLAREVDELFAVGEDLGSALEWLCESGTLTAPIGFRWFESFVDQVVMHHAGPGVFAEVRDALAALGVHDHLMNEESDDDTFAQFFVPAFHGTVSLFVREPGTVDAIVRHDPDADPAVVRPVVGCLTTLGLSPQ